MTHRTIQPDVNLSDLLPGPTRERFESAGLDISQYPFWPQRPTDLALATAVRDEVREHNDPGLRADKSKKALFSAAKEVIDLSPHLGTGKPPAVSGKVKDLH